MRLSKQESKQVIRNMQSHLAREQVIKVSLKASVANAAIIHFHYHAVQDVEENIIDQLLQLCNLGQI